MDSLKTALQNAKSDTSRLRIYLALGDACERQDKDKLLYAKEAFTLVDKQLSGTTDDNQIDKILKHEAETVLHHKTNGTRNRIGIELKLRYY